MKSVRFGKGQTHVIEDSYRTRVSGGGTSTIVISLHGGKENLYVSQFTYIMASGGSWHGNIGDATLKVEFKDKKFKSLRLVSEHMFGDPIESKRLATLASQNVIWSGFATPESVGNHVVFTRHNFKPTAKDDVTLTFDWLRYDESTFGSSGH